MGGGLFSPPPILDTGVGVSAAPEHPFAPARGASLASLPVSDPLGIQTWKRNKVLIERWGQICEAGDCAGVSHRKGSCSVRVSLVCAQSFATAQLMGSNRGCSNLAVFDHVLISYLMLKSIISGLTFSFGRRFENCPLILR